VQERLDVRFRHLLVDEFQDTSPLQWQALHAWLSAYAGAGGGASGQSPPGIFIVGDPKQSIYRFRGAEPRVFAAAAEFVRDGLDGSVLACDHTRRNAPEVVAAINGVFGAATAAGDFPGFRPHTTEVASPAGSVESLPRHPRDRRAVRFDAGTATWRDTLTTARLEAETVLREREAATVGERVVALLAHGTAPDAIFVLCRKRETLRLVAAALEREHVAHSAVEDTALAATPEAQDLIAVLDAIVSPAHRLSLARALRSPLFAASDDDLFALAAAASAAGDGDWWRALAAMASPGAALAHARTLLQRWRVAAAGLPPHDLLDRIVGEGELRERIVAVVPPEQRALALDAIDAVLAQALLLDGGRYATPYAFVRALKRRAVKSAPPLRADAIRLLTVHGAKGLEADTVLVTDADPERPGTETTTLLVDWPVDAAQPRRCAFVYNEARCPPSLATLLGNEIAAREREEMNALYVAMTRAKQRLVFSATEPFQAPPRPSWWQRVQPFAVEVGAAAAVDAIAARPRSSLPDRRPGSLRVLPKRAPVAVLPPGPAQLSLPFSVERPRRAAASMSPAAGDERARSLGRAVHRFLEWAAGAAAATPLAELAAAAAGEFGVAADAVAAHGTAILRHPEGARFFVGPQILWSGNEVAIGDASEVLRVDRLVRLDEASGPSWWVLDYKLHHRPEELAPYRAQLLRYRAVVERAQPGESVRCAFVTGEGRVVEVA
jgi:ATP-dependent helicase/nuclease subunit A